jgi:tetraacyldisaccharide 4'-kinase
VVRQRLAAGVVRMWAGEGGAAGAALRAALRPAEAVYRGVIRLRNAAFDRGWRPARDPGIPVVSVGNLTVGGTGKTPLTAWMVRTLAEAARRPAVVLRGYGDDETREHTELNPDVPVFPAPRRIEGATAAREAGCDVVVLDDGFQHRVLARDLDLVLIAAEQWTPRPRLLPAGRWREGLRALARADAVIVTRKTASDAAAEACIEGIRRRVPHLPIAVAAIRPGALTPVGGDEPRPLEALAGSDVLAAAGLADPAPFFGQLRAAGLAVEEIAFPDHHPYAAVDGERLADLAAGRPLLVTRKDAVKLRPLLPPDLDAWVVDLDVRFERGEDAIRTLLADLPGRAR